MDLGKSLDMKPLKLILSHLMKSRSGPSIGWKPEPPICPSQKMSLEPFKKLQVTVMEAPPHHQAIPARNTHNERFPNPALRALILPLQDVYVDARVLVEKRIVSTLASLQYATNRSLEDWLLIVKILVVIGSVDDWDSRSSTIIFMPLTSWVGGCLCYSGEEPASPVAVIGFIPKISSQVHHQRSTPTRVIIKTLSTSFINQPPKAVDGVCSLMPSKVHHQPVAPTTTKGHARLIQKFARSHSLLEDCSPIVLIQKANQTSSCRGHERTLSPECKNCLLLPYPVASSNEVFSKSPLKRQSSRET
ncbi:Uncharacterized protein Rs2_41565 [Raphanus sativus]|nr:Uncharacterized protein Rs2_41565 [Raphanus sativus]